MFGRSILVSEATYKATVASQEHRLVPVDVLGLPGRSRHGMHRHLQVSTPRGVSPTNRLSAREIVFECAEAIVREENEWMYQLQVQGRRC